MNLKTEDFDYVLPPERIAVEPLPERDASRMLVLDRKTGGISHHYFRELPDFFEEGDLAVLNNSRVIRARLPGPRPNSEVLLVEKRGEDLWMALVRPGRLWKVGARHEFAGTCAEVIEILEGGERVLRFEQPPDLERFGAMPLPPYLRRKATSEDDVRYQNVFAGPEGSVAAPTAGLHFNGPMLSRVPHCFLTLHVGPGTFLPVKTEFVRDHKMHCERYSISEDAASAIRGAKRVLAVGTTVTRVLESLPRSPVRSCDGATDIFISPPFDFQKTNRLLTNFHLPKSSLLMLVSAFAGIEAIREAYREAVRLEYRFYSYGDCMLIL